MLFSWYRFGHCTDCSSCWNFALTTIYCFIGFVIFTGILMFSCMSSLLKNGFLHKGEKSESEIKEIRRRGLGDLILPMICTSLILAIFSVTTLFYLSFVIIFVVSFICALNTKMIMKNWFYILVSYVGIFYVLCYVITKLGLMGVV